MIGYEKNKYKKVELSYFELQMIAELIAYSLKEMKEQNLVYCGWMITRNLEDLQKIISDEICQT